MTKEHTEIINNLKEIKGEITRGFNKLIEIAEDYVYEEDEEEDEEEELPKPKKIEVSDEIKELLEDGEDEDLTNWEH